MQRLTHFLANARYSDSAAITEAAGGRAEGLIAHATKPASVRSDALDSSYKPCVHSSVRSSCKRLRRSCIHKHAGKQPVATVIDLSSWRTQKNIE